jgi:hypothetical protein
MPSLQFLPVVLAVELKERLERVEQNGTVLYR